MNSFDIKKINNSKVTIIGMGKSGISAARLANYYGAEVFISEIESNSQIKIQQIELKSVGITTEIGRHTSRIYKSDLWVISPGVPKDSKIIIEAKNKKIQVISEIEFASWFANFPIIAVTGSNGKTTTASILNKICKAKGNSPAVGGNIGIPFSELILQDLFKKLKNRIYILEVSSFQLEHIVNFKPLISIFLNISPDHLDRHVSMKEYVKTKFNLTLNQDNNDHIVFNIDDKILAQNLSSKAKTHTFGLSSNKQNDFILNGDKIYDNNNKILISLNEIKLIGKHNLSNILAAVTAAKIIDIPYSHIRKTLSSFNGVEHRLEEVSIINGIRYFNDSKATNIDSVKVALDSFDSNLILILGGKNKGSKFDELLPHIKHKVKLVITYGDASEEISTTLRDAVKLEKLTSFRDAVEISSMRAVSGDNILLSPGCASFDQFSNFEERGKEFKKIINQIHNL